VSTASSITARRSRSRRRTTLASNQPSQRSLDREAGRNETQGDSERNCAFQFFTDADWRDRYVDDEVVASRMVAQLRAVVGSAADSGAAQTVETLQRRSEEFSGLWDRHDVMRQHLETKRLHSPLVGMLQLNFVTSDVAETGHRLTVMTPKDETTALRLAKMAELIADIPTDDPSISREHENV
ncbi:MAG TPA: hypothetical protein H9830_08825, partial [Candidatus Agrococcus pullicola]|nr:hypothetical protein [Candidatus Agrococcus pullicola]